MTNRKTLRLLRIAAACRTHAASLNADVWQFSLELRALEQLGASLHDLRWMIANSLVEHRLETTSPDSRERTFRRLENLSIPAAACFVITKAGLVLLDGAIELPRAAAQAGRANANGHSSIPHWDPHHRVLSFDRSVLKAFRVPAPNQEVILSAFAAAGWPPCLNDPLADERGQDPRQRLGYAIKGLNRSHTVRRIRFFGDGTGRRICWKTVAESPSASVVDRTQTSP